MKAGEGLACSPSPKTAVEIQGELIGKGRSVDHLLASFSRWGTNFSEALMG